MNTKYDWSNVPKEVKWVATDADGVKCCYSKNHTEIKELYGYAMKNILIHGFAISSSLNTTQIMTAQTGKTH